MSNLHSCPFCFNTLSTTTLNRLDQPRKSQTSASQSLSRFTHLPSKSRVQGEPILALRREGTCLFCPCEWRGPGPPGGSFLIRTSRPGVGTLLQAAVTHAGRNASSAAKPLRRFFEASQEQLKTRDPARTPSRASQTLLTSLNLRRAGAKDDDPRASPFNKHPLSSPAGL